MEDMFQATFGPGRQPLSRLHVRKCADAFLDLGVIQAPPPPVRICSTCNGYYGPAFWQPVCATCHAFLYANDLDSEINLQIMSQADNNNDEAGEGADDPDRDSGNEEDQEQNPDQEDLESNPNEVSTNENNNSSNPVPSGGSSNVAVAINLVTVAAAADNEEDLEPKVEQPQEILETNSDENNEVNEQNQMVMEDPVLRDWGDIIVSDENVYDWTESRNASKASDKFVHVESLSQRLALLSYPRPSDNISDGLVEQLPPEVLVFIFSFLDDVSLYAVGHVCKRWGIILSTQLSPEQWQTFTRRRWPLFQPLAPVQDWFFTYSALVESSFCLTCIYQMSEVIPADYHPLPLREKRLIHDLRLLADDPPPGIKAQPLDSSNYHWQASITGPTGSPYEGGIFFLYVKVPLTYPFDSPQVRFLTRIFHPNISRHGDIGIDSILPQNWVSGLTIPKVLISIQSLLTDPYCDVCMEPEIGSLHRSNKKLFDAVARQWTWNFAMHDALPPKPKY